eukprot:365431-Chlamydomonas_euryale.AAC.14
MEPFSQDFRDAAEGELLHETSVGSLTNALRKAAKAESPPELPPPPAPPLAPPPVWAGLLSFCSASIICLKESEFVRPRRLSVLPSPKLLLLSPPKPPDEALPPNRALPGLPGTASIISLNESELELPSRLLRVLPNESELECGSAAAGAAGWGNGCSAADTRAASSASAARAGSPSLMCTCRRLPDSRPDGDTVRSRSAAPGWSSPLVRRSPTGSSRSSTSSALTAAGSMWPEPTLRRGTWRPLLSLWYSSTCDGGRSVSSCMPASSPPAVSIAAASSPANSDAE